MNLLLTLGLKMNESIEKSRDLEIKKIWKVRKLEKKKEKRESVERKRGDRERDRQPNKDT